MEALNTRGAAVRDMRAEHAVEVLALHDQLSELASGMESIMAENAMLTKIIRGDAGEGALATIQQLNKEVAGLRERVAGLQDEKNLAVRAAKAAGRRVKS